MKRISPQEDKREIDMAAIEKLHRADIDATMTQDLNALNNLWSEGAVKLDVPGSPVVGLGALKEMYEKFRANYPDFKVVKYAPVIAEVQIADGWAIEIGTLEATYKMSSKDEPVNVSDKGVRVLKRQSDASWKFVVVGLK
jgi:ketosteroid isomerase-like protein